MADKGKSHNAWLAQWAALYLKHGYRLDIGGSLSRIPLDESLPLDSGKQKIRKIKNLMNHYLNQDSVKHQQTDEIAQYLVKMGRERAETKRWEVFALDLFYACPHESCRVQKKYATRDELRIHLLRSSDHVEVRDLERAAIEEFLDQGRRENGPPPNRTPTIPQQATGNGQNNGAL